MMHSPTPHVRVHPDPRITANDLARYMVASETGKIGIIRRAREAVTPAVTRYSDARRVARAHLADLSRTTRLVIAAIQDFERRAVDPSLSDFTREDARLSVDVLQHLLAMQNQLGGYAFIEAPRQQPNLMMAGVEVAVNLDLLVTRIRGVSEEVGGALFRLTKAEDETDSAAAKRRDMGLYAATLAHMQVRRNLAGNREPQYQ